jgi:hypothetical protein
VGDEASVRLENLEARRAADALNGVLFGNVLSIVAGDVVGTSVAKYY